MNPEDLDNALPCIRRLPENGPHGPNRSLMMKREPADAGPDDPHTHTEPQLIVMAARPSTTAYGRVKVAFLLELAPAADADEPMPAIGLAEFRLEMN